MSIIWMQIKFVGPTLIIHGLAIVQYSLFSSVIRNVAGNCISESQNCSSVDDKVICYRLCSNNRVSWNDAERICAELNSTLPVIRNKKEQESLENYFQSLTGTAGTVWTSGRKVTHGQWTWLNGQPFRGLVTKKDGSSDYWQVSLKKDHNKPHKAMFSEDNPLHPVWFLCQYQGTSCSRNHVINLRNSCVIPSNESLSWYSARNVCLDGGGDLAVLSDQDLKTLESHPTAFIQLSTGGTKHYWIGLGKISWQWTFLNKKSEDVKYSNWSRSEFPLDSDLCISIQASNGEWVARNCNFSNSVICQIGSTRNSPTTTLESLTLSTSINNHKESTDATTMSEQTVMYALLGVGVLLIFICIICIFLLVRRKLKRAKEIRSSKANTMQLNNESDPDEKPTKKSPESTTASEDEVRGVYAEISPPKNSNKDLENAPKINPHQPSGTVYASLEFKKDAIYANQSQNPT